MELKKQIETLISKDLNEATSAITKALLQVFDGSQVLDDIYSDYYHTIIMTCESIIDGYYEGDGACVIVDVFELVDEEFKNRFDNDKRRIYSHLKEYIETFYSDVVGKDE
jgi:hypothetical protein